MLPEAQATYPRARTGRPFQGLKCMHVRLFGVAPGGGCRVSRPHAGHAFTRLCGPIPRLGRREAACCVRPLAVTLPCGVRTFLSRSHRHIIRPAPARQRPAPSLRKAVRRPSLSGPRSVQLAQKEGARGYARPAASDAADGCWARGHKTLAHKDSQSPRAGLRHLPGRRPGHTGP
jgi:hypothetical protein